VTRASGSIQEIWRFPVKSMQGESLQEAAISGNGLSGDRAYGLLDVATGTIASAKKLRLFPDLMRCHAAFVASPQAGGTLPPVAIRLPDGRRVRSDDAATDQILSDYFERELRLVPAPAGIYTYKHYSMASARSEMPGKAASGALRDAQPMSMLTTSTLARLQELQPDSQFDARRFRMNVIIATEGSGFVENDWLGHDFMLGRSARLTVTHHDPRCVMVTLAQDGLALDPSILQTIRRHNGLVIDDSRKRPCAGVYAAVAVPGMVRVGDLLAQTTAA